MGTGWHRRLLRHSSGVGCMCVETGCDNDMGPAMIWRGNGGAMAGKPRELLASATPAARPAGFLWSVRSLLTAKRRATCKT